MEITIYQLTPELDKECLMFSGMEQFKKKGYSEPPANLYESVYSGDASAKNCEDLFRNPPADYTGRPFSVSDVVEFRYSQTNSEFFFFDIRGFLRIPFNKKATMSHIINHTFDGVEIVRSGIFEVCFLTDLGLATPCCSKVILENCKYSQCQLGYELKYRPFGEELFGTKQFLDKPVVLLAYVGLCCIPQDLLYEQISPDLRRMRYRSHSPENFKLIEEWCKDQKTEYEYL